ENKGCQHHEKQIRPSGNGVAREAFAFHLDFLPAPWRPFFPEIEYRSLFWPLGPLGTAEVVLLRTLSFFSAFSRIRAKTLMQVCSLDLGISASSSCLSLSAAALI